MVYQGQRGGYNPAAHSSPLEPHPTSRPLQSGAQHPGAPGKERLPRRHMPNTTQPGHYALCKTEREKAKLGEREKVEDSCASTSLSPGATMCDGQKRTWCPGWMGERKALVPASQGPQLGDWGSTRTLPAPLSHWPFTCDDRKVAR